MNEINKGKMQMNREETYSLVLDELRASKKLSQKEINNSVFNLVVVENEIWWRSKQTWRYSNV
jgi:hypothetical protein